MEKSREIYKRCVREIIFSAQREEICERDERYLLEYTDNMFIFTEKHVYFFSHLKVTFSRCKSILVHVNVLLVLFG